MVGFYKVVTDGKTYRIKRINRGADDNFVCDLNTGSAIQFSSKEEAERYIHDKLSMSGWYDAQHRGEPR